MISIPGYRQKSQEAPNIGSNDDRLFRRFHLFAVASIAVILFVAGLGLRHVLRDLIIAEAEYDAIQVTRVARDCEICKYVEQYYSENEQVLDIPASELPLVDSNMRVFTDPFNLVKIKIYNVDHRIIYSSDPKVIGRYDPHNALLLTALSGTPVSKYQSGPRIGDFEDEEPMGGDIAETYVPILGRDGRVIGSFEIYKDISKNLVMMREILVHSWSVLAVTVLGVFAVFMFVIRRAVQTIKVATHNLTMTNERLQQEVEERKKLENELLNIIEQERQRIGQELHDGIGQQLAGITFMADVLKSKLRYSSLTKEILFARRISTCVGEVAQQTRNLARGLAPIDLNRDGLAPALEELAANTSRVFNVSCTLECERAVTTNDASVTINVYRIAQEAITNAIKHGKAKNIMIRLKAQNGHSELSVENDGMAFSNGGAGLAPGGQVHNRGMGLRIMRYRAERINGSLDIHKGAYGGTFVNCVFPNEAESR